MEPWVWIILIIFFFIFIAVIVWLLWPTTPTTNTPVTPISGGGSNTWLWVFGIVFFIIIIMVLIFAFMGTTATPVVTPVPAPIVTPVSQEPTFGDYHTHDHFHAAPNSISNTTNHNYNTVPTFDESFEMTPEPVVTPVPQQPRLRPILRTGVPVNRATTQPNVQFRGQANLPVEGQTTRQIRPNQASFDPDPRVTGVINTPATAQRTTVYHSDLGRTTGVLTQGGGQEQVITDYGNHRVRVQ